MHSALGLRNYKGETRGNRRVFGSIRIRGDIAMSKPVSAALGCFVLVAAATCAQAEDVTSTAAVSTDPAATQDQPSDAAKAKAAKVRAQELETVTVTTGTRSAKAVDKIPGAITVVTQAEIDHTLALTDDVTAVLARTVPGYAESSQAMSNTGENLRGRIALRLFDGIPQGSPLREGTRNGTFTDMGVVSRVEVINGPSASEGIGAAGGIINYISAVPDKNGDEWTLTTRYTTQFRDDSGGYKVGLNYSHKQDNYDMYLAGSYIDRGITWDANGRRQGINSSGSLADSESNNFFAKFGYNFGEGSAQRIQLTLSKFKVEGKDNYIEDLGSRASGLTDTAIPGHMPGSFSPFNDFWQIQLKYQHSDFFGGTLNVDAYRASQAMRYLPENTDDKQDPLIAPLGTLVDQSEINSQKKGLRGSWTRPDIFSITGLELHTGLDLVEDTAQQKLAITNRLWVPPMDYKSVAPYAQLSWDLGPVTLSGGYRHESGTLDVDSYTTTYYRNRVFVQGGSPEYTSNLPNFGAVWRFADEWSAFASWSKGFTLPNVGIPLRNINKPGQSVDQISDLQAIVVENKEVGFNWRGERAGVNGSVYRSYSELGASLAIDPATNDYILTRAPVLIKGGEISADYSLTDTLKATVIYSRIMGHTTFGTTGPLTRHMGVTDVNPDKIATSLTWQVSDNFNASLGETTLLSRNLNQNTSAVENTHGYTLWDLGMNYRTEHLGKLTLGFENLTNKYYILSWSQAPGYQNFFAGRGRVVSLTDKFTF
jgi:iron complex outermembrane recepter protein